MGASLTAVAVAPPVDTLAARRLPVHMGQHVVLVAIAAPLLAAGLPALTRAARRPWPVVAVVAVVTSQWVWHSPRPFDAAVRAAPVHAVEHLVLLGTAIGFWVAVVAMARHAVPGAGALALVAAAIANTLLGATITLWPRPLYTTAPSLPEQQLAGVVMWAGGGLAFVVTLVALFHRWLGAAEVGA